MYAVKVKVTGEASTSSASDAVKNSGTSLLNSNEGDRETETIQVSAGNPRVEHITGLIHLYRQLGERSSAGEARPLRPVSTQLLHQCAPAWRAAPSHRSVVYIAP